MSKSKEKQLSPVEQLQNLLVYFEDGSFESLCRNIGVDKTIYDKHIAMSIADFIDSLNEIQDELHTEELLADDEQAFLDEWDSIAREGSLFE